MISEGANDDVLIASMAGMREEIEKRQLFISYHLNEARKLLGESIQLKRCLSDMEEVRRKKIAKLFMF
jgi:hypothetical protein